MEIFLESIGACDCRKIISPSTQSERTAWTHSTLQSKSGDIETWKIDESQRADGNRTRPKDDFKRKI